MNAPRTWSRRSFVGALATVGLFTAPRRAAAGDVTVPIPLQVELFAKVAQYDRALPERAPNGIMRVLVLEHPKVAASMASAGQVQRELATIKSIAGLQLQTSPLRFSSAEQVAAACREARASALYFTPGLSEHAQAIATQLQGTPMLTCSLVPDDVETGAVLGFDLEEGKPRILVNLRLARAHDVRLKSSLLKLASIVER